MNLSLAIFYGLIQGLTEFLPVSSSGHLALLPYLFSFEDPGVAFDLMMHIGTALAVLIYYYKDILQLISDLPGLFISRDLKKYPQLTFFILSTLASVVLIVLLKGVAEHARASYLIAFNMIFFGFLLWQSSLKQGLKSFSEINYRDAILIGLAQSIAIFPGVSRSGITLTAAYLLGYNKLESGRMSFLMSLPIILAGAVTKLSDLDAVGSPSASILMAGVFTSFVVGILTIHYFMKFISRVNFASFFVYRLALGIFLFYLYFR